MLIIGCDFHTRYQQIAMAREETAELLVQRRLKPRDRRNVPRIFRPRPSHQTPNFPPTPSIHSTSRVSIRIDTPLVL